MDDHFGTLEYSHGEVQATSSCPTLFQTVLASVASKLMENNVDKTDHSPFFRFVVLGLVNVGKTSWIARLRQLFSHRHGFQMDQDFGWISTVTFMLPTSHGRMTVQLLDLPGTQFYIHLDKLKEARFLDGVLLFHNMQYLNTFYPAVRVHQALRTDNIPTCLVNYQLQSLFPLDPLIAEFTWRARQEVDDQIGIEVTIPPAAGPEDLLAPILALLESILRNNSLTTEYLDPESDDTLYYPTEKPITVNIVKPNFDYGVPQDLTLSDAVRWLGFDSWDDLEVSYDRALLNSSNRSE